MSDELELEQNATQVDHEYGGSEIQVLEGLEAVRKRPGMYIGSTSSSGLHHLVYEIVDNSIDEALAGYCDRIDVAILEGDVISVTDNGRGIPVDVQPQTACPRGSGVHHPPRRRQVRRRGLQGFRRPPRRGRQRGQRPERVAGGAGPQGRQDLRDEVLRGKVTQSMTIVGETDRHGTEVVFKPDPEMFEDTVYDYETLHTRMREEAFLNAGLKIVIQDRRPGMEQEDTMHYEGGIREFVTFINKNKTPIHDGVIYMSGMKDDSMAEIAMQYTDTYNEILVSFANNVHTPEGGMHETGFKQALTNVLNAYGKKMKILKDEDKVSARTAGGPDGGDLGEADRGPVEGQTKASWATPTSAPWSTIWSARSWRSFWRRTRRWARPSWTRPSPPPGP